MNLFEQVQRTTGVQLLPLLEINCNLFADTIRLAGIDQADPVVSNGNLYVCYPFDFTLPQDDNDMASQMTLSIGNAGTDITADLEAWVPGHPVQAKLLLVDPAAPSVVFKTFFIPISSIQLTPTAITATCGNQMFLQQKASKLRYDQYLSPGLF